MKEAKERRTYIINPHKINAPNKPFSAKVIAIG